MSRAIGLVALGYPARILGPENFGLVGLGTTLAAYASILLSPGLLTWGMRAVARDRARAGEYLVIVNATQIVLACLSYSALVAYSLLFLPIELERLVVLVCGLTLFNAALSVDWVFNGLELMRVPAWIGTVTATLTVVALFSLVHSPQDILVYAALGPAVSLTSIAISYGVLLRRGRVRLIMPGPGAFRQTLLDSLPLGVMAALVVILHYANNLIVQAYLGTLTLGVFLAAFRLLELTIIVPSVLAAVFLPRLARFVVTNTGAAVRDARVFAQVHMIAAFFIAALMFAEAPTIIDIVYGSKYIGAIELLRVMAVAVIFNYAICGYTNCLISFGRDRVMVMVVVVSAVVAVGGGLWLVPRIGALGAALVVAGIDFSGWLVSLPFYRRTIGTLQFEIWLRPMLGGLCVTVTCLLLQVVGMPFWIRVPVATLAYVPFVIHDVRSALK